MKKVMDCVECGLEWKSVEAVDGESRHVARVRRLGMTKF